MSLHKAFYELIFRKNFIRYLLIILSLISSYIATTIFIIYIDNLLLIYSKNDLPQYRYILNGIRAVFVVAIILFIGYQFYNIMKISLRNYIIITTIGASKQQIRMLIILQFLFLLIISIPLGLNIGHYLSCILLNYAENILLKTGLGEIINSNISFSLISVVVIIGIIVLMIDLDRGLWKSIDIEEGKRHYIS